MHRALLLVLGLLAATLLSFLSAAPAHACSCVGGPLAERISGADAVFSGTPTARDEPEPGPVVSSATPIRWTFTVDTVHRGDVGAGVDVAAAIDEASCGLSFTLGQRYLVVGTRGVDGTVDTNLCTGTTRYGALTTADRAALGPGSPVPAPPPDPVDAPAVDAPAVGASAVPVPAPVDGSVLLVAVAAALGAVVVAAAWWRRRR